MLTLKLKEDISPAIINKELTKDNIYVSHLVKKNKSLEKRFLEILEDHA